jgi:intein/homing endonuclease
VAEKNFGGDMVAETIRHVKPNINVKLVWSSRGKLVRAEPISALYEQGKVFHAKKLPELEDELCVVGNTLVLTENGEKPIKDIKIGDKVFTRQGYKRVLWSGKTGETRNLIKVEYNNTYILSTNKHPVYNVISNSWKNAEDLCQGDIMLGVKIGAGEASLINQMSRQKSTANQSLCLAQDGRLAETDITKGFIKARKVISYIGRYGKAFTDKFLKVCRYITKTGTDKTIPSRILNVFRRMSIILNDIITKNMLWKCRRREEVQLVRKHGKTCLFPLLFAPNAEKSIKPNSGGGLKLVRQNVENVVKLELRESVDVYNLRVEDSPEYFANGILIHNCLYDGNGDSPNRLDAHVFGLSELSEGGGGSGVGAARLLGI